MLEIVPLFTELSQRGASDIFIVAGRPLSYKADNLIYNFSDDRLMPGDTARLITSIYELSDSRNIDHLITHGDDDFSFSIKGVSRFRVSTYKQRGSLAAVVRIIAFELPRPEALHIPPAVMELAGVSKGLVLVTGPSGSGKSTTLACLIDRINSVRSGHIITLEDPIEFVHSHKQCIVSQREIALDTDSYIVALRAALRQTPDVILIGELRDNETISTAMTAAETGHLVISTLHTLGAANTIDRIVDVFPAQRQTQIRIQLSMVLQAVVSQQLVPDTTGTVIPAFELMKCNMAVRNMIRESKTHQLDSVIASSSADGMMGMDASLIELIKNGDITAETALAYSMTPDSIKRRLG